MTQSEEEVIRWPAMKTMTKAQSAPIRGIRSLYGTEEGLTFIFPDGVSDTCMRTRAILAVTNEAVHEWNVKIH